MSLVQRLVREVREGLHWFGLQNDQCRGIQMWLSVCDVISCADALQRHLRNIHQLLRSDPRMKVAYDSWEEYRYCGILCTTRAQSRAS